MGRLPVLKPREVLQTRLPLHPAFLSRSSALFLTPFCPAPSSPRSTVPPGTSTRPPPGGTLLVLPAFLWASPACCGLGMSAFFPPTLILPRKGGGEREAETPLFQVGGGSPQKTIPSPWTGEGQGGGGRAGQRFPQDMGHTHTKPGCATSLFPSKPPSPCIAEGLS